MVLGEGVSRVQGRRRVAGTGTRGSIAGGKRCTRGTLGGMPRMGIRIGEVDRGSKGVSIAQHWLWRPNPQYKVQGGRATVGRQS